MEDTYILELYFQRDEAAISETALKYGAFCPGLRAYTLKISSTIREIDSYTGLP